MSDDPKIDPYVEFVDQDGQQRVFLEEYAVAALIMAGMVFFGEDMKSLLLCNDTFDYASADAEDFSYEQIQEIYDLYAKHGSIGIVAWIVNKRKRKPLPSVIQELKDKALWTKEMESYD